MKNKEHISKIEFGEGNKNAKLKVLAYHKISQSHRFEAHIKFVKEKYNIIDVNMLKEHLFHQKPLPKNPLLITFDDGDLSIYENAFPVLKKYNVPAVIFIITGLINSYKPFWWDEIIYHLREEGEKKVWEVKNWSNSERKKYLNDLRTNSDKSTFIYKQLTNDQLTEMSESGIAIANHSFSHPIFDRCTEEELREEISKSREFLKTYQFEPDIFAYPNGNFSERTEKILKNEGINMAFLFDHKINAAKIENMQISRLIVDDITPLWKFKLILSGLHTKMLPFTKKVGKILK